MKSLPVLGAGLRLLWRETPRSAKRRSAMQVEQGVQETQPEADLVVCLFELARVLSCQCSGFLSELVHLNGVGQYPRDRSVLHT